MLQYHIDASYTSAKQKILSVFSSLSLFTRWLQNFNAAITSLCCCCFGMNKTIQYAFFISASGKGCCTAVGVTTKTILETILIASPDAQSTLTVNRDFGVKRIYCIRPKYYNRLFMPVGVGDPFLKSCL